MKSLVNLLTFLDENWSQIVIVLALLYGIYLKAKSLYKSMKQRKIDTTILIVSQIILEKLAVAEDEWNNYVKTGTIKRSKVINEIYESYPILKEYIDQDYIINKLDELIDNGLKELKKTLDDIKKKGKEETVVIES